jgi:hypothetical protein
MGRIARHEPALAPGREASVAAERAGGMAQRHQSARMPRSLLRLSRRRDPAGWSF